MMNDFNAFNDKESENKDSFIRLNDIMIDIFEDKIKEHTDLRNTIISRDRKTKRRLDYIFINNKFVFNNSIECNVDSRTIEQGISDHKILQLELKQLSQNSLK